MKRYGRNHYELSTGKMIYALDGIVGLTPDDDTLYYGFDGTLSEMLDEPLTNAEKLEVANYMIELWTEWKVSIPEGR